MKTTRVIVCLLLMIISLGLFCTCRGETGPKGDQGPQGVQGPKGEQGETGEDGHSPQITIGENGNWYIDGVDTGVTAKGQDGTNGENGLSAYETYIKFHPEYSGTEEEWIQDLINGKLISQKHTVTFNSDGGTAISSQEVLHGDKVTKPNNPIKDDYTFAGWYVGDEEWSFIGYTVTEDVTLTAKWISNFCDVTYVIDEETAEIKRSDKKLTLEYKPTKQYYNFLGWTLQEKCECILDEYVAVADEVTLYAKWEYTGLEIINNEIVSVDTENIVNANIPYGITNIAEEAFKNCSNLKSVIIPNSVTSIGRGAFYLCTGLTSVIIPNSVTIIDEMAFYCCGGLTSVIIPNSVLSIGANAFDYCKSLTSVVVPDSVTSIGSGVFSRCTSLTSATMSNSVSDMSNAFQNCTSLTQIVIPNSVTSIVNAFGGCTSLTQIIIPSSVTNINGAFSECTSLTEIVIPNSVTSMVGAFRDCTGLTRVVISSPNTKIARMTFSGCSSLTSVIIPNSVTKIDDYAFKNCEALSAIYFEGAIEDWNNIEVNYDKNEALSSAIVYYYSENEPTDVGNYWCFNDDGDVEIWPSKTFNVVFETGYGSKVDSQAVTPSGLITEPNDPVRNGYGFIGWYVGDKEWDFAKDKVTSDIVLEAKWINAVFFSYETNTEVIITNYNGVEEDVVIPRSINGYPVTTIGESAFCQSELKTVSFPKTLTTIGDFAFCSCVYLKSVYIPANVSQIGVYAFADCFDLESIEVSQQNVIYDSRDNCNAIIKTADNVLISGCKNTVIPSSVIRIEECAFSYCESLTQLVIPVGVESIGALAFEDCIYLNFVIISSSVTVIEEDAFSGCTNLIIYYEGESIPEGWEDNFNPNQRPVYCKGEWEYDENGNPVIINQ